MATNESKQPGNSKGENKSCGTSVTKSKEQLVPVKLHLPEETAKTLNGFLVRFQKELPLVPFFWLTVNKVFSVVFERLV